MIEIKELVVRAIVVEDGARPSAGKLAASPGSGSMSDEARTRLIEDCVRQVLAILERQTER